ncbi:hypothetical protein CAPTEDRAFT_192696 [Capitella teleta]|uniref:Uncharacterized protein n=1 Tax=Capitella teleta TaxID=283909 RepID=R7UKF5_CAPTE|nr:hypothetical protein CAPTEDRAFT_192696 [Capitella teleta]|eukprot:ELU04288.1 hypothetical protein CAPTEDRAFT_192696 [Capitella teleta]
MEVRSSPISDKREATTVIIIDVSATERFIKRVGFCDGDKPSRTLEWLRAIDRLPDNVQVEIALQTAESTIHSSLRELKNAKWPKIKTLLANRYVNANFSEAQKEALDRLEQRPGEGLYVLLNEAYQALPLDQTSLIRTFLCGLSDRDMAKSVARKKLRTLPEVVKEVRRHYQDDDLLRPRKISKVHAIDKYENPQVSALSVVVTDLVNMQKETNAQIAALAKAVVNNVIDAYRDIFSVKATPVNEARSLPPALIDTASEEPVMEIADYAHVFVQLIENHLADNRWSFICSKLNYQIEARSHMYVGELRSLDTLVQKRIEDTKHRISKTDRNRRGLFDFVGDIGIGSNKKSPRT